MTPLFKKPSCFWQMALKKIRQNRIELTLYLSGSDFHTKTEHGRRPKVAADSSRFGKDPGFPWSAVCRLVPFLPGAGRLCATHRTVARPLRRLVQPDNGWRIRRDRCGTCHHNTIDGVRKAHAPDQISSICCPMMAIRRVIVPLSPACFAAPPPWPRRPSAPSEPSPRACRDSATGPS